MLDLSNPQEFQPLLASRRFEIILWGASVFGISLAVFVPGYRANAGLCINFFLVFMVLSAVLLSLNSWNERKKLLRLDDEGVSFKNGLRQVEMKWEEISRIQVYPGNIGDKIIVQSENAMFIFHTLGEMKVKGEIKDRTGFEQGQAILETTLGRSGLAEMEKHQEDSSYYYVRE
jgi:hypothetical protein